MTSTGWSARTCASPVLHELDANKGSVTTMAHHVLVVGGFRDKVEAAVALVEANPRSIVFTRTREGATELAEALGTHGIEAVDLHGNLSQRVRERNLHKFSSGKASVVVATDVAARGIHVDSVGLVVHFDAPADAKAYLHRSGRTARAGEAGAVVSITTPRQVDDVVRLMSRAGVESLHHDSRTTPRPMTAEALATSGSPAPQANKGGSTAASRGRSGGYRGGSSTGGYRGAQQLLVAAAAAATAAARRSRGGRGGQAGNGRPKTVSRSERWSPADR